MPAATGTAGGGTTPTSPCRTCPGTSSPATSRRSAPTSAAGGVGDRVTVPFVCACGRCEPCRGRRPAGLRQPDPARLHPLGLVRRARRAPPRRRQPGRGCPDELDFATAAGLGCRFATAYRAVVASGRVRPGEWVAVHGCGGVGLSAVMIAVAAGARVVAVDVSPAALELARAARRRRSSSTARRRRRGAQVIELTGGGAHLSLDALGAPGDVRRTRSRGLRPRGRHVQVGLLPAAARRAAVPMELVIARELEMLGSHGMAAHDYPAMLGLIAAGRLRPPAAGHPGARPRRRRAALAAVGGGPASPWSPVSDRQLVGALRRRQGAAAVGRPSVVGSGSSSSAGDRRRSLGAPTAWWCRSVAVCASVVRRCRRSRRRRVARRAGVAGPSAAPGVVGRVPPVVRRRHRVGGRTVEVERADRQEQHGQDDGRRAGPARGGRGRRPTRCAGGRAGGAVLTRRAATARLLAGAVRGSVIGRPRAPARRRPRRRSPAAAAARCSPCVPEGQDDPGPQVAADLELLAGQRPGDDPDVDLVELEALARP